LLVEAFKEGVLHLLGVLFIPFFDIYFAIRHWQDARNALMMRYIGYLILNAGLVLGGLRAINEVREKAEKAGLDRPSPDFVQRFAFHEPCGSGFQS